MTEELEQLLKNLKLRRILDIYDEQLRAAEKKDLSYASSFGRRTFLMKCTPRWPTVRPASC